MTAPKSPHPFNAIDAARRAAAAQPAPVEPPEDNGRAEIDALLDEAQALLDTLPEDVPAPVAPDVEPGRWTAAHAAAISRRNEAHARAYRLTGGAHDPQQCVDMRDALAEVQRLTADAERLREMYAAAMGLAGEAGDRTTAARAERDALAALLERCREYVESVPPFGSLRPEWVTREALLADIAAALPAVTTGPAPERAEVDRG